MSQNIEYFEPVEISVDRENNQLRVVWNDDHQGLHNFETLRWNCPCAGCRGEMGMPGRLDSLSSLRPEETQLQSLEPIGLYAIRPTWSDGHETGLYTYEHLRDLCECAECMQKQPDKFQNHRLTRKSR